MDSKPKLNVSLQSKITIAHESFRAAFRYTPTGLVIGAQWENEQHHKLEFGELLAGLGLPSPEIINWSIELENIHLYYDTSGQIISMGMVAAGGQNLLAAARIRQNICGLQWNPNYFVPLKPLPLVGNYFEDNDEIRLERLQVIYAKKGGFRLDFLMDSIIRGTSHGFGQVTDDLVKETGTETESSLSQTAQKSDVHWIELNKKIGPVLLRRIGGSFEQGVIRVSLDASLTVSILTLDVMGLYLGIRPGKKFQFDYGLKGLAISVCKPPLFISGGLYVAKPWSLFNGQITIRYAKFGFLALGSYGLSERGEPSFFAYLMLDYPLGGPPCFYLTGICAGFGVNRKIHLPEIKKVRDFPLVAAARGASKALTPDSRPADVLSTLSDVIEPCDGMNFLTAGVKFTSFGMVESVVVINAEFGTRFELSLLGVSEISLPPKTANPIVYGCLNLRVVFCPDDGILRMEGAMSNDSYLFSKDARLTGGFAFYTWFRGEHAGDFVLSVGGYHPKFQRRHYPAVDRVGLNWMINSHLDIKGEAYFALMSNGLMAGGRLELNYHAGKLRAWCNAYADFLIQWKPFHYDIAIGVSVGASYRLDAWFIHHTFQIELGASLHLWGPEFSGMAHISWHIISFTIHFNSGNKNAPPKLGWTEFRDGFLPKLDGGIEGSRKQGVKLARLNICRGHLGRKRLAVNGKQTVQPVYYIDPAQFEAEIESVLPLEALKVNGVERERQRRKFGILPMGVTSLEDTLEVSFDRIREDGQGSPVPLDGETVHKHLPRALWDTRQPDMNEGMLPDVMTGYRFRAKEQVSHYLPPEKNGEKRWYQMEELLRNEAYHCPYHYQWISAGAIVNKASPSRTAADTMIENKERDKLLTQMKGYGIRQPEEIETEHFVRYMDRFLSAPMEMRSTGYREKGK
ncbi:MAG: hypothetical protein NC416_02860 [Eubacterium sp.]|nr:hypothetical protein [Eubacterium sp.]